MSSTYFYIKNKLHEKYKIQDLNSSIVDTTDLIVLILSALIMTGTSTRRSVIARDYCYF